MDISGIESQYTGGGSEGYPPKMLVALIFYCYASGIFSSRKIEKATYELIPVIFIVQGLHPDHSVISKFRKRFLKDLEVLFTQILLIASEMGILKLGDISLDGTKIKANASKHRALSYEYACKLEDKLKQEIATLMAKAKESDNSDNNGHDKKNNNSSDGNKTSLKYTCDTCNVNVNSTTQLSQVINLQL